jgi:serine/threonine protein kinase
MRENIAVRVFSYHHTSSQPPRTEPTPEQVEGREANARTDIFAFGEVLYEMTTGRPAFSGRSRASLIAAILSTDPRPIAELAPMLPPTLGHVIKTYLAKDPDNRIAFFADGKLKKLEGGPVQIICDAPSGRGGTWNKDGVTE